MVGMEDMVASIMDMVDMGDMGDGVVDIKKLTST